MFRAIVFLGVAACALAAVAGVDEVFVGAAGGQVVSTGKPELDEKAGVYTYTDANGRTSTIREGEVVHVMKR